MNIFAWVLLVAYACAAVADWMAVARRQRDLEALAKPATLVVLILLAWLLRADSVSYGRFLLLGLLLSLVGDIALLGDSLRRFRIGLGAFLLAHLAYLAAFRRLACDGPIWPAIVVVVLLVLAVVLTRILPRVRADWRDGIPLLLYAVVLGAMTAVAWGTGWVVVGVGATLFLVSDAILAYDRFERELPWGKLAVHVTYHLSQLLIVWGMLRPG
jgi:uncharacterized membrane protein YhhN